MLIGCQLTTALSSLPLVPAVGDAYRVVRLKYANSALSSIGSRKSGGRYNPADAFEVLYMANSSITALTEVRALISVNSQLISVSGQPRVLFSLQYSLSAILDLTDSSNQQILGTSLQELTGAWIPYSAAKQISPTQQLGASAYALGNIEGLKVPSAPNSQDPSAYNLAIFPERLLTNSYIEIRDESGNIRERISSESEEV